jgi:hypothetical protein
MYWSLKEFDAIKRFSVCTTYAQCQFLWGGLFLGPLDAETGLNEKVQLVNTSQFWAVFVGPVLEGPFWDLFFTTCAR